MKRVKGRKVDGGGGEGRQPVKGTHQPRELEFLSLLALAQLTFLIGD